MKTLESNHTIAALIAHVVSECKPVDIDSAYDEYLDTQGPVRVAGLTFDPSQIIKELDPTAYNCGMADFSDGMDWTEIEGETYADEDIETSRTGFIDGLNDELADLQTELENEEGEDEPDAAEVARLGAEIANLESFISECESYSF